MPGKSVGRTLLKSFTLRLCIEHSYANMASRMDEHIVMPSMGLGESRDAGCNGILDSQHSATGPQQELLVPSTKRSRR